MLKRIVNRLIKWCEESERKEFITGSNSKDVYMVRYTPFKSKLCTVYIHRFLRPDADPHHDHPYNFLSYVVKGAYVEDRLISNGTYLTSELSLRKEGSWAFRRAKEAHKIVVDANLKYSEREKAPVTLCITGRKFRDWGFLVKDVNECKWVFWKTYLNIDEAGTQVAGEN